MHVSVRHIFDCELTTASTEVTFLIPVPLQVSIDSAHHCEGSNVKLSVLVQKRLLDVLLNDVTPLVPIKVCILN